MTPNAPAGPVEFLRKPSPAQTLRRDLGLCFLLAMATAIAENSTENASVPLGDLLLSIASVLVSNFLGFSLIMLVLRLAHPRLALAGVARWLGLLALVLVTTVVAHGVYAGVLLLADDAPWYAWLRLFMTIGTWVLLLVGVLEFGHRRRQAAQALHEAGLRRLSLQAELAASHVQVLRAQIEPHFLFNSLANVRRLVRTDALAAREMIHDLLRYLEMALPRMREENATLAGEVELARSFLAVHRVRMGERLRFAIDVPAALAPRPIPPMMLITLIENALKHGLQPLAEGGSVRVSARAAEGKLLLSVADDGLGMGNASGQGTGLANIRARLRAIHGPAASLSLRINEPRGVVATISLPENAA